MTAEQLKVAGWSLVNDAASVCKPLLWLRDTDSCLPLAPKLLPPLRHALHTVVQLPDATAALCEKMISIYRRAVENRRFRVWSGYPNILWIVVLMEMMSPIEGTDRARRSGSRSLFG
ncbi:MAG: hypothetical protein HY695_28370, partial [Deltaproteobacteria bacterium]|nr:hypothetical protein [Deltaproteobacteria bacterium]